MINYLEKLKKKCDLSDDFIDLINQIFDKLLNFGYITHNNLKKLQRKLYNNIDTVIIGKEGSLDYKSGYYDAIKKELYIKDIKNTESIYLRIIYILTTNEISDTMCDVGYSKSNVAKTDYKIVHKNFGINRAIVSNLVCRLLYTVPTTLSIVPTYRSYYNDFLGNKIVSDNDIYFLEGKLLSQLCFALDFDEEKLYVNLFNTPDRYLNRILLKSIISDPEILLNLLDKISKNYSNYNKLVFLNKLLNENYLEKRKNILNEQKHKTLVLKEQKIIIAIQNSLAPLVSEDDLEEFNTDTLTFLSQIINNLEEQILIDLSNIQSMFVDILILTKDNYEFLEFAVKLKQMQNMLVLNNEDLNNAYYNTLFTHIFDNSEHTTNLVTKIKYSLANVILLDKRFSRIIDTIMFNVIEDIKMEDNSKLIALTTQNSFLQLYIIRELNLETKDLKGNVDVIELVNLRYLLNNNTLKNNINKIENMFTGLKNSFDMFKNLDIENIYICNIQNIELAVIVQNNTFNIVQITRKENLNSFKLVELSNSHSIFGVNNKYLPVLYNNKDNIFKILFKRKK